MRVKAGREKKGQFPKPTVALHDGACSELCQGSFDILEYRKSKHGEGHYERPTRTSSQKGGIRTKCVNSCLSACRRSTKKEQNRKSRCKRHGSGAIFTKQHAAHHLAGCSGMGSYFAVKHFKIGGA